MRGSSDGEGILISFDIERPIDVSKILAL